MFQKPAFGTTNTSTFGSFNAGSATASPFGGFKSTTGASTFGAPPAFGAAAAPQPAAGPGLFGASNTSGGLFGNSTASTSTPAFGASTSTFGGFGASTSSGGLFNNSSTGLFGGTQNTSAFGAKPAAFGFGSTTPQQPASSGLFGAAPTTGSSLFPQQTATLGGGGGLFNNTSAFGQQQTAPGTGHVKYNPVVGTDVVVKSGTSQNINIKHHCITCMKEYENKSLEELRLEDYTAGRKGQAAGGMFGGSFAAQPEAKPLFGGTTFGAPAATTASSVFGGGGGTGGFLQSGGSFSFGAPPAQPAGGLFAAKTGFGATPQTVQSSVFGGGGGTGGFLQSGGSFSFGAPPAQPAGGLFAAKTGFGAAPQTGTGLFGATTTQAPSFGATNTSTFGLNVQNQQQSTGIFGQKPATSTFGTTGTGAFGSFGTTGGLFPAKPAQPAPAFGTTPAFGLSSSFGAPTSTSGGLFTGAGFGKPAPAPALPFSAQPAPAAGVGLGGLGGTAFANKGAPGGFGTLGSSSIFQPQQTQNNFLSKPDGGLGGGMFNSSFGQPSLGIGMNTNTSLTNTSLGGSSAAGSVHEQILTLAARPYGDSPLFKHLLPEGASGAEDVLKPTNPAAVKAVLEAASAGYRVASPASRLRLQPRPSLPSDKKCLFDGLEESDASLEDKLSLKPSKKRLVLRTTTDHAAPTQANDRSLDETRESRSFNATENGQTEKENESEREKRTSNNGFEYDGYSAKNNNWKTSNEASPPKFPQEWEKEKSIDGEATPRIYPNLDKEMNIQGTERRASWLTTKPLRVAPRAGDSDSSVRELRARAPPRSPVDTPDAPRPVADERETLSFSEDEHVPPRDAPPHPAGVKLTRPGYYTIPTLDEMVAYMRPDGSCVLPHLTVGRHNYGNVFFDCEIDVAGLDLDALVHFLNKEVIVYPEDGDKPPVGQGLNRRAIVTLDRVWPRDKTQKRPITEPDRLLKMEYETKLRRVCDKHDTKFIEYRPGTGSWVFRVEHFSKYGLSDSDEEDDAPLVLRRQLATASGPGEVIEYRPGTGSWVFRVEHFSKYGLSDSDEEDDAPLVLRRQLATASAPKPVAMPSPGLGGLGSGMGLAGMSAGLASGLTAGLAGGLGGLAASEDTLLAMHQTSLNLLNGAGKTFEMDTTEDNTESQSLYPDHRAFGVKSPTSELARLENRQSHHVQLMKASLYADAEMEDDVSISTGDQLVPISSAPQPLRPPSAADDADVTDDTPLPPALSDGDQLVPISSAPQPLRPPSAADDADVTDDTPLPPALSDEVPMPPLIVRPHTIVLKYHRKVPPFGKTIAGRLQAACVGDMSVCRARHARAGFGPRGALALATSLDAVASLPKTADLSELGKYVAGRAADDWSEAVVMRLSIAQGDSTGYLQEALTRHMETLLEYSELVPGAPGQSPMLRVKQDPALRRRLLAQHLRDARQLDAGSVQWGVSSSYCHQVWKLCDALWGADLDNGGIPGKDVASVVNRHRKLLEWMTDAVAAVTDDELAKPSPGEEEDEEDGHSSRVWTLLLGGRVLEACKVAREHGDYNMAALIAQSAGSPATRALISRQLGVWAACGAEARVSAARLRALRLAAAERAPRDLAPLGWLRALHATARYLCPQVPTLEQVVRTYESFFVPDAEEDVDLAAVEADEMGLQMPRPPYLEGHEVAERGGARLPLDLRYELIRARATHRTPRLRRDAYTPDPLDYSLCFLLGSWFGGASPDSITGMADQLEGCGLWHLAVHALAYHPDQNVRGHLIRGVLSRHAPAKADTPELVSRLEVVKRLEIPAEWLLLAQAHRAKYENLPRLEAEHLAAAGHWNAAHRVLLDQLLPTCVLADDLQSIAPLLEKMNEAAQRHAVSGWEAGGQALYHYLHVCDEIRGLVSSAEAGAAGAAGGGGGAVSARLEALRPRVAAACRSLKQLKPTSARHAAARAEMGARLVQLALAGGEPAHHLAALLRALQLPPDCTHHAHHKITTDLAEQASDSCIESANSSPLSSHHRPALHT